MAALGLRLRRSFPTASFILNHHRNLSFSVASVEAPPSAPSATRQIPNLFDATRSIPNGVSFQFMFSRNLSSRPRYNDSNMDGDQISPDAILFEGCDYNHWLITIDFPKDPAPTPEEMVETYVQTAAKVLGSVEEAKKKIYACSTTTYHGFQVEVSEEVSEKFNGLPGVVFVLPDSYIDPVNKEYGGDKYINGTIIPRPPPVQFGRQRGRYNDQNRDYNRPPRGPMEGSPPPQHNYGDRMPMNNAPGGQGNYQGDRRGPMPSYQANYNQGERRNLNPAGQTGFPQTDQRSYARPEQRDLRGEGRTFAPPQVGNYNQEGGGGYMQGTGGNYGRGTSERFGQRGGAGYGQGTGGQFGQGGGAGYGQGTGGQFGQGGGTGYGQGTGGQFGQGGDASYGQGADGQTGQGIGGQYGGQGGSGNYQQGRGGNYDQGTGGQYSQGGGSYVPGESRNFGQGVGGAYGQGIVSGQGQNSSQYGGNPSSPQVEQRNNMQGQQGNYDFMNKAGDDQGSY